MQRLPFSEPLGQGSSGMDVLVLQALLLGEECFFARMTPNGFYCSRTKHAVENFQVSEGLVVNGIFGDAEMQALKKRIGVDFVALAASINALTFTPETALSG